MLAHELGAQASCGSSQRNSGLSRSLHLHVCASYTLEMDPLEHLAQLNEAESKAKALVFSREFFCDCSWVYRSA